MSEIKTMEEKEKEKKGGGGGGRGREREIEQGEEVEAVERLLWDGFIPIQFTLAECDTTTARAPDPPFVLLSRMSYLVAAVDAIEYLRSSAVLISDSDVWFEANGLPLKRQVCSNVKEFGHVCQTY
jgi:hypothetical protein